VNLMKTSIRLTILASTLGLMLACTISTIPSVPPTAVASPTAAALTPTLPTVPASGLKSTRGIFIVTGHNTAIDPATYTNPSVDGIVIRTYWSDVQPGPDQYDWSFIDSQIQAASASGKKVMLVVMPGAFTPTWALQGVRSAQFVVDYGFIRARPRAAL